MKESGECPKCQSRNIWNNTHIKPRTYIGRKWIIVKASLWPSSRKYAFRDEYVCLGCGYYETYVDKDSIETIKSYGYPDL